MKQLIATSLFFVFLFSVSASAQRRIAGEAKEVLNGNTFTFNSSKSTMKVRLQFIDPPDASQPLYDVVKNRLASILNGKRVEVQVLSQSGDIFVSKVFVDDVDVSMQMLRDGAAWYSEPEAQSQPEADRLQYQEMERLAKSEKRGVWGIEGARPAWALRIEREKAEQARRDAQQKQALEEIQRLGLPTQPAIGMTFMMFKMVCGTDPNDSIRVTDTASSQDISIMLKETPERIKKMCFGYFSFTDDKLTYISREN